MKLRRSLRPLLPSYDSVSAATAGIGRFLTDYSTQRPHASLTDRTPDEVSFHPTPLARAA
ncbi:MAG: integrase core domain-containing protein [Gemmatimonadaceae bacterium]